MRAKGYVGTVIVGGSPPRRRLSPPAPCQRWHGECQAVMSERPAWRPYTPIQIRVAACTNSCHKIDKLANKQRWGGWIGQQSERRWNADLDKRPGTGGAGAIPDLWPESRANCTLLLVLRSALHKQSDGAFRYSCLGTIMTQTHHFELFFDLRAPAWTGRSVCDTYNDAADICAWVDDRQFESVTIGEHHMVDDHYISAPLIMCGAFAARTKQLRLKPILLASFYEPIRLAEELNVLQVLSRGRVVPVISGGYRKVEFDLFGKRPSDRLSAVDEVIEVLRASRAGEPFHYRGRAVPRITPVPEHPLPILMAATYPRIARHAAGNGADGLAPNASVLFAEYAKEVVRLGRPD
ncbi:MAG: LLM class flavin-dependent oxidoreductase, partial [Sphingomonadales bacterium]